MTQIATEAGHWYAKDGAPAYQVPGKNGELRNTTLRDARKMELVPSVSMIMRCASADALERWKRTQLLMSALTLPRVDGESLEEFSARIVKDSEEQAGKARDLGTLIHGCIEKSLKKQYDWDQAYAKHVNTAIAYLGSWCGGMLMGSAEKSFYHPLGYGGKCDFHRPGFVADFKTKEFTADKLPDTYENHAMQLAAYREGFNMPRARCAIIYVSTSIPGLTHTVEVSPDELDRGWEMFKALLTYWKHKNKYLTDMEAA